MKTSSMEPDKLKAVIKEKIHHTYIGQYVRMPCLNEDKLSVLSLILNNTSLPAYKTEKYITAAMLVQMALDTHDAVPDSEDFVSTDYDEKAKQLGVLAGDYYSGLYYFLLSEIEDSQMIQVLATAITDINEYKMQLYYKNSGTFKAFFDIFKKLDTLLITRIAAFTGEADIGGIAAEWLMVKKFMNAQDDAGQIRLDMALGCWSDLIPVDENKEALYALDSFIRQEMSHVQAHLADFPPHLAAIKTCMLERFSESAPGNNSTAEEG